MSSKLRLRLPSIHLCPVALAGMAFCVAALAIILQLTLCAGVASADGIPVLSVGGPNAAVLETAILEGSPLVTNPDWWGLSFTLDRPFHDLTLSVPQLGVVDFTGTAWLTTAVGVMATASDVIATSTITDQRHLGGVISYSFFNELDLGRGTYYFLMSSPYFDDTHPLPSGYGYAGWNGFSLSSVQALPGVHYNGGFLHALNTHISCGRSVTPTDECNFNYDQPYASKWTAYTDFALSFEITQAVPEPPSVLLFGGGFLLVWLVKKRVAH